MSTRKITVTDPREFDGDPYQVAERAIRQAAALVAVVSTNIEAVDLMARNAELERQLAFGVTAEELRFKAQGWPESPQGRRIAKIISDLEDAKAKLDAMVQAVGYNPKARSAR